MNCPTCGAPMSDQAPGAFDRDGRICQNGHFVPNDGDQ